MNGATGGDGVSAGGYTGDAQGDFGGGSGGCACSTGDGGGGGGDYGGRGAGGSIDDGSCLSEQNGTLYRTLPQVSPKLNQCWATITWFFLLICQTIKNKFKKKSKQI